MAKALTIGGAEAQYAIEEVFRRINKLSDDEKNSVVGQIFGNEAGLKKAILTLADKSELLSTPFQLVAYEVKYLGSMQKEYEARAATTSNSCKILSNTVKIVAAALGSVFLPAINEAFNVVLKFARPVLEWIENNKKLVKTIGTGVAIFLSLIAVVGSAQLAFGLMLKPIISLINLFVMLKKAMLLVNVAMLANPIGIVITAITALIAVGYLLYKNWDIILNKVTELWNSFSDKFPGISDFVKSAFEVACVWIDKIKYNLFQFIDFVGNIFTGEWGKAWENVKNILVNVFSPLVDLIKVPINGLIELINKAFASIGSIGISIPDWVPGGGGKKYSFELPQIPMLAKGCIAISPTLAMIGEGSESEAVMPLSMLDSMLGTSSSTSITTNNAPITVSFAPTINIQGDQNVKGQVNEVLSVSAINFKNELEMLLLGRGQVAY